MALASFVPLVSITRIPAVPAHLHVLHVQPGHAVLPLALARVRLAPRDTTAPPLARLHVRSVLLEHTILILVVPAHLHVLHVQSGLTVLPLALPCVRLAPRGTTAHPVARLHVRPVLLGHITRTRVLRVYYTVAHVQQVLIVNRDQIAFSLAHHALLGVTLQVILVFNAKQARIVRMLDQMLVSYALQGTILHTMEVQNVQAVVIHLLP